jgi:hypothetical protein
MNLVGFVAAELGLSRDTSIRHPRESIETREHVITVGRSGCSVLSSRVAAANDDEVEVELGSSRTSFTIRTCRRWVLQFLFYSMFY